MEVEITAKFIAEIIATPASQVIPRPFQLDVQSKVGELMTEIGRPGTGGRQPRVPAGTETAATASLRKRYGEPLVSRMRSAKLELWEVDGGGDGVIAARLFTEDLNKGEKVEA